MKFVIISFIYSTHIMIPKVTTRMASEFLILVLFRLKTKTFKTKKYSKNSLPFYKFWNEKKYELITAKFGIDIIQFHHLKNQFQIYEYEIMRSKTDGSQFTIIYS